MLTMKKNNAHEHFHTNKVYKTVRQRRNEPSPKCSKSETRRQAAFLGTNAQTAKTTQQLKCSMNGTKPDIWNFTVNLTNAIIICINKSGSLKSLFEPFLFFTNIFFLNQFTNRFPELQNLSLIHIYLYLIFIMNLP